MTMMGFKKSKSPKGVSYWHERLWKVFSEFIRRRDADENGLCACISCGRIAHWKQMDAGHFIGKGVSLFLKYDERNVNAQCGRCNLNEGNYAGYREGMIKKYGLEVVEELEAKKKYPAGFTAQGLEMRFKEYKSKL